MDNQAKYQQLQPDERMTIAMMRQQGSSVRAMARTLERAPSTLSREIKRNGDGLAYASHTAQVCCSARRQAARPRPKLDTHSIA